MPKTERYATQPGVKPSLFSLKLILLASLALPIHTDWARGAWPTSNNRNTISGVNDGYETHDPALEESAQFEQKERHRPSAKKTVRFGPDQTREFSSQEPPSAVFLNERLFLAAKDVFGSPSEIRFYSDMLHGLLATPHTQEIARASLLEACKSRSAAPSHGLACRPIESYLQKLSTRYAQGGTDKDFESLLGAFFAQQALSANRTSSATLAAATAANHNPSTMAELLLGAWIKLLQQEKTETPRTPNDIEQFIRYVMKTPTFQSHIFNASFAKAPQNPQHLPTSILLLTQAKHPSFLPTLAGELPNNHGDLLALLNVGRNIPWTQPLWARILRDYIGALGAFSLITVDDDEKAKSIIKKVQGDNKSSHGSHAYFVRYHQQLLAASRTEGLSQGARLMILAQGIFDLSHAQANHPNQDASAGGLYDWHNTHYSWTQTQGFQDHNRASTDVQDQMVQAYESAMNTLAITMSSQARKTTRKNLEDLIAQHQQTLDAVNNAAPLTEAQMAAAQPKTYNAGGATGGLGARVNPLAARRHKPFSQRNQPTTTPQQASSFNADGEEAFTYDHQISESTKRARFTGDIEDDFYTNQLRGDEDMNDASVDVAPRKRASLTANNQQEHTEILYGATGAITPLNPLGSTRKPKGWSGAKAYRDGLGNSDTADSINMQTDGEAGDFSNVYDNNRNRYEDAGDALTTQEVESLPSHKKKFKSSLDKIRARNTEDDERSSEPRIAD